VGAVERVKIGLDEAGRKGQTVGGTGVGVCVCVAGGEMGEKRKVYGACIMC
jgi:hypothetical protein